MRHTLYSIAYALAWWLATPLILLHLLLRSRRQPEYRQHWGERFGFYRGAKSLIKTGGRLIWIHAVSVGETRAAQSLIAALRAAHPNDRILITHMTPTGRATSEELFDTSVLRCYLPYDYGFAVRRFLRHFQPSLGLLIETEVWPTLLAKCRKANVPMVLVNGRLSEKSLNKALRWQGLIRPALQGLNRVLAQTPADAQRLRQAGAIAPFVTGNLKFDMAVPPAQLLLAKSFKQWFGLRPVLLFASTREGEEVLLLDALLDAFKRDDAIHSLLPADVLCVIVPRHPQRFDAVAELLQERGLRFQRRSALHDENAGIDAETRVLLGDSMGEMLAWYAAADLAFIGGSLMPLGGQNLIEACAVGCPVLIGPHTHNFAQVTRDAIDAGAAICVNDAEEVMRKAAALLRDDSQRRHMCERAVAFIDQHRGATQRMMAALEIWIG